MGYEDPPWVFAGRALYQLHLVKASEARKHVPAGLPLVQCFGYTLGGVFLARYTDSPVGPFDELVTIAGLVWNFPGSAAWASRVYVSDREACSHGRSHCGLPSAVASFEVEAEAGGSGAGRMTLYAQRPRKGVGSALRGGASRLCGRGRGGRGPPICRLQLPPGFLQGPSGEKGPSSEKQQGSRRWPGPPLRLRLPNYSGGIPECPGLLRYACRLAARVRPAPPIREVPPPDVEGSSAEEGAKGRPALLNAPLVTLLFSAMSLSVAQPLPYVPKPGRRRHEALERPQPALVGA